MRSAWDQVPLDDALPRLAEDHAPRHWGQRGGSAIHVPLQEGAIGRTVDPRHATVVEPRYFAVLGIEETAEALRMRLKRELAEGSRTKG